MKKLVFIQNPRAASTAIATALGLVHSHETTAQMQARIGNWDECFSFSFVRSPLDRLISVYEMVKMKSSWHYPEKNPDADRGETLEDYCRLLLAGEVLDHSGWLPQTHFVDQEQLDFVGRYEQIGEDWLRVSQLPLKVVNVSERLQDRVNYYTPFICEAAARLYRSDYCQFNYIFPLPF